MRNGSRKPQFQQNLNLIYQANYITPNEKKEIMRYLESLYPIWEMRFSASNPPPEGEPNRPLLRPVYWLGNWQFACLDYYHPPKGIQNRCVEAESYPPVLEKIVKKIEQMVHEKFNEKDIPRGWHLNTCLINYYGNKILPDGKKLDTARVGEHKDFEPGPVASISFGEKALFQFIKSESKAHKSDVILQQWLEDSSLQIFGGDKFKKQLFHRVQRVEEKGILFSDMKTTNFETRRINFTFRFVPNDHIKSFNELPENLQSDIKGYVAELGEKSQFWRSQIN
ncbi:alpha-ketoglutarate-dependent dioxygenase AlkB [Pseudobdellovibrio sp. HCB154]|uniref:alpha-ketoglutarate-dependent dioxygenase AlkB n=1 Tax=Pseudobdellovibrio sp. HCB154 TaxID=3386277 RepID=UPI003916D350